MLEGQKLTSESKWTAFVEEARVLDFFNHWPIVGEYVTLINHDVPAGGRQWFPSDWLDSCIRYMPNYDDIVEIVQDVITADEAHDGAR